MSDIAPSAGQIRQRLDYYAAAQVAAETRRASMLADRADAIAILSTHELDEIDDEVAALAVQIERAASRVAALRLALTAAEVREAVADARRQEQLTRAAWSEALSNTLDAAPNRAQAVATAQAALSARNPTVEFNPTFLDEKPAPRTSSGDNEAWWRDREARLRAEGTVAPDRSAPAPVFSAAGFGAHNIR